MTHDFKIGERIFNGGASATVLRIIADDALEVIYDCDPDREPVCEPAFYFKRLAIWNAQTKRYENVEPFHGLPERLKP